MSLAVPTQSLLCQGLFVAVPACALGRAGSALLLVCTAWQRIEESSNDHGVPTIFSSWCSPDSIAGQLCWGLAPLSVVIPQFVVEITPSIRDW